MIKQVRTFEANKHELLADRVNAYLTTVRAPLVHDIKYNVTWDENGLKYGALVVTEEQERAKSK